MYSGWVRSPGGPPLEKKMFRKLFKLPSPVDLGWSKYNALEDEEFSDNPQGKTWQQWHRTVKDMHPVKYFLSETLASFVKRKVYWPIKRPISDAHYWLVSHLVPSRRYHMLDLRQVHHHDRNHPTKCYHYGWVDVPDKMLFALFNLLGEYLTKEKPHDPLEWLSQEKIDADDGLKAQQAHINEARAIHHWWTVERDEQIDHRDRILSMWSAAKKRKDPQKEVLWDMLKELEAKLEAKDDEMVARLMKIRRTLWT